MPIVISPLISTAEDRLGPGEPLAISTPARPRDAERVLLSDPASPDGRSAWVWLRLADNALALAVFPRGATYEDVADQARFGRQDAKAHVFPGPAIPAGDAIALIHPAGPEIARRVIRDAVATGSAGWCWIRQCNGDLALGLFPIGLSAEAEADAAWPGLVREVEDLLHP